MNIRGQLKLALNDVRKKTNFVPKVALVLGSGLGEFANRIKIDTILPYQEITGFPTSTVAGHKGQFVFGWVEKVPVVIMQGRVHYYEGYSMDQVVMPIRLMGKMGAEVLFLTNAAGGCNPSFQPGDLMLITDQISSMVPSPLIGPNVEQLGTRFPDMSQIYRPQLQKLIEDTAQKHGIPYQKGVYLQFTGPQYESPAEIRFAQTIGADAVGMSTTCEAIAGNHMGLKVCGISCITNMASGLSTSPLNHKEVQETADRVAQNFETLVYHTIATMEQLPFEEKHFL